ncbi:MAG: hypothetical protein JWO42_703 [Chloroflexi bacterium]|nr:hypothetical protein [Chloroflexota bacterium]
MRCYRMDIDQIMSMVRGAFPMRTGDCNEAMGASQGWARKEARTTFHGYQSLGE